jgi:hypothetical protein
MVRCRRAGRSNVGVGWPCARIGQAPNKFASRKVGGGRK